MKSKRPSRKRAGKRAEGPNWGFVAAYAAAMILLLWVWQETVFSQFAARTIPYSEFKAHLARGELVEVSIGETEIYGKIQPRPGKPPAAAAPTNAPASKAAKASPARPFAFRTVRVEDPDLTKELEKAGVRFSGKLPNALTEFLLSWVLPILLMAALWIWLARRFEAPGQSMLAFRRSRARLIVDKQTGVRFRDVAGCEEAKLELAEVVDFLKRPQRYRELGARIPKGILLVGPPGTGKTLLARAAAGEAKVPFFSISGSDFVEMFVGVGAARVRDLFEQAQKRAPCIVFIDEIDAIGRQRGVHMGPVNDEREQTLNALLVEMDGFEPNSGVIILAATNRPEILDRALLRPGRFDRQIVVDAPDLEGRRAILEVHVRNKPLASDVDLRRIAAATAGFSGADLANAVNEAALLAARRGAKRIAQQDLEAAVEKVIAGPERKSRHLTESIKRRVAYHETGHALVGALSPHAPPVRKISVIPRGHGALGYTLQLPEEDQCLLTRSELLDRIKTLLGGRAAEEIVFGEVSTGAQNDLERATQLARQMVVLYGMSERTGLAHWAQKAPGFAGDGEAGLQRDCSEQTAREIDEEVRKLLEDAYAEAKKLLISNRKRLERVAAELLRRETLDGDFFRKLLETEEPETPGRGEPRASLQNKDIQTKR